MTIAGPGGTKNFFSDPPSGTVFALGSLVDVGPLQWPGGRLKREILRCYTFLPIFLFPPKLRVIHDILVRKFNKIASYMMYSTCMSMYVR